MFGKLIGEILSTPVRLANVPIKVVSKVGDAMCGETDTVRITDRDPIALDELAEAIEDACDAGDD
jgi:hypothetical protein